MVSRNMLNEMNTVYYQLEQKCGELMPALKHSIFEMECGWFNGHYQKAADGKWVRDAYPIPVITVKGLCDIEIQFDRISVSTKLKRADALSYSYEKVKDYEFEAYGVDDYLTDYYHPGQTIADMKAAIEKSNENEICFSFMLDWETNQEQIYEIVKLLRREGFYY